MLSRGIRMAATLIVFVSVTLETTYGEPGTTCGTSAPGNRQLQAALENLHDWLDTGEYSAEWREYLMTEKLLDQLAEGAQADPAIVAEILGRYAYYSEQLDGPRFFRVRKALEDWLAGLPPPALDQIAAECRAARAVFVPQTESDLQKAKSELRAAVARLDARLKSAGPEADGWRSFLKWETMQEELARQTGPELSVFDKVYARYASGHEGLGLVWFIDVRHALMQYLSTARSIDNPKVKLQYEALLGALPDRLEAYRKAPTPENAHPIGATMRWLDAAGQAKRLAAALGHHFTYSNLFAEASADLIAAGIAQPVDDIAPVHEFILGTDIRGPGHTIAQVMAELVPSAQRIEILTLMRGTTETETIGTNGPVCIYTTGTTQFTASKPILIDTEHVWTRSAETEATISSTITDIRTVRGSAIVERLAWRRATRQKSEADRIGAWRAEQRVSQRMDEEADELIGKLNEAFENKFRKPLIRRKLFPQRLQMSTTEEALRVTALEVGRYDLGAPGEPPPLLGKPDLAIRLHESMVNNLAAGAFAGMILKEERLQAALVELLGSLPEELQSEDEEEPWVVTFARQRPISVRFADGQFSVTIRGREYAQGEKGYPGMNVTATYRIEKTDEGFKAVRRGDLEIFPPGFVPGKGRQLSGPEMVLRTLLQRRLAKVFAEEVVSKHLVLPGNWSKVGQLALSQWEASDGWLVMAWKRIPPAKAASTKPARSSDAS